MIFYFLCVFTGVYGQNTLAGIYKTKGLTSEEKLFMFKNKIKYFEQGNELMLKNDSSFQLTTCGNIMKGYWKLKEQKIMLVVNFNEYRLDSLKDKKLPTPSQAIIYEIWNNKLYNIDVDTKGDKTISFLTKEN